MHSCILCKSWRGVDDVMPGCSFLSLFFCALWLDRCVFQKFQSKTAKITARKKWEIAVALIGQARLLSGLPFGQSRRCAFAWALMVYVWCMCVCMVWYANTHSVRLCHPWRHHLVSLYVPIQNSYHVLYTFLRAKKKVYEDNPELRKLFYFEEIQLMTLKNKSTWSWSLV